MAFTTLLFYIFSFFTVGAGVAVISSRNPVHSVLWLIFAFMNAAGLFLLMGAEMLAMLLVIVYVGAVAVLFLFVVMMLSIKMSQVKKGFQAYLPLGLLLAVILLAELIMVVNASTQKGDLLAKDDQYLAEQIVKIDADENEIKNVQVGHENNVVQIGRVLYTDYILYFQASGLILLVAMIGAIVLTLRHREGVRRQKAFEQNRRSKADTLRIVSVETGKGID